MVKEKKRKKRKRNIIPSPFIEKLLLKDQASILKETEYIVGRAMQKESRVVAFASLILFSTETGDCWVLDAEDELALCLSKDGERKEYSIQETSTNFVIEWNANYRIEQDKFIVHFNSGEIRTVVGYPINQIISMSTRIRNAEMANSKNKRLER